MDDHDAINQAKIAALRTQVELLQDTVTPAFLCEKAEMADLLKSLDVTIEAACESARVGHYDPIIDILQGFPPINMIAAVATITLMGIEKRAASRHRLKHPEMIRIGKASMEELIDLRNQKETTT